MRQLVSYLQIYCSSYSVGIEQTTLYIIGDLLTNMFARRIVLFILFLLLTGPMYGINSGASVEDSKRLQEFLKKNNDQYIIPKLNQSAALDVYFRVFLAGIQRFDEIRQILQLDMALHFEWKNELISWNTSDYGGLDIAFLTSKRIWLPDIGIFNIVDDWNERLKKESMNAILHPNGTVNWAIHFTSLGTVCSVDITKYPFDMQTCKVTFGPFYLPEQKQKLMPYTIKEAAISTILFVENNEWQLMNYSLQGKVIPGFEAITHHEIVLQLKRRSLFYTLTVITPVLTLSVMNVIAFKLPASSGEKAGYCMAMFLTFVVLLNTISDSMLRISKTTSYLQVYIITQLITSMIITTVSVGLVNLINKQDQRSLPGFLVSLVKNFRRKAPKPNGKSEQKDAARLFVIHNLCVGKKFCEAAGDSRWTKTKIEDTITKLEATDFIDDCLFHIFILIFILSTLTCTVKLMD